MRRFFKKSSDGFARTAFALFLVLFVGAAFAGGETLKRFSPPIKVFEPDAAHLFHAADVPAAVLKAAAKILPARFGAAANTTLYKMPQRENLYLAAVSSSEDSVSEYVLMRVENGGLNEIGRSPKIENAIVNTTFFVGRKKVLLVADVAVPPDFESLAFFEFGEDTLKHLGNLSIAAKTKKSGLPGDFISPAANAAARLESNAFHISFRGNLYSDWGGAEAEEVKLKSPAAYFYNGREFQKSEKKAKR